MCIRDRTKSRATSALKPLPFEMQFCPGVPWENPGSAYQKLPMQRAPFAQQELPFGHRCCEGRRRKFQIGFSTCAHPDVHRGSPEPVPRIDWILLFSPFPAFHSNHWVSTSPVSFHAAVVGFCCWGNAMARGVVSQKLMPQCGRSYGERHF